MQVTIIYILIQASDMQSIPDNDVGVLIKATRVSLQVIKGFFFFCQTVFVSLIISAGDWYQYTLGEPLSILYKWPGRDESI